MNWIEEIGKFIRLLTDRYEAFDEPTDQQVFEAGYMKFFDRDRNFYINASEEQLRIYMDQELQPDQFRPLAMLVLFDGLHASGIDQIQLLTKARFILNYAMQATASFAFQDGQYLSMIEDALSKTE